MVGYGAVGRRLIRELSDGIPGLPLAAVATRRVNEVKRAIAADGIVADVVGLDDLPHVCDMAVERTAGQMLPQIAVPMLRAGKEVIVLSAGALLEHPELLATARQHGGKLTVPTGALLGLDVVAAASLADDCTVRVEMRKPPRALAGAPFRR